MPEPLTVACLCADWCHICNDYQQTFDQLAAEFSDQTRFVWVDIEEHDDAIGALDIENFPTLLIGQASQIRFFGPVIQYPENARQIIRKALAGELVTTNTATLIAVLAQVRAL